MKYPFTFNLVLNALYKLILPHFCVLTLLFNYLIYNFVLIIYFSYY